MTTRPGFASTPVTGALVLVALAAVSVSAHAQRAPTPPATPPSPTGTGVRVAPRSPRIPVTLPGASGWVGVTLVQTGHGDDPDEVRMEYPVIASVEPGSPAQSAGLVAGDTVLSYNNVDAHDDPLAVQRFLRPGERLVVRVRRGDVRSVALTVAKRPSRSRMRMSVSTEEIAAMPMPIMAPLRAMRDAPLAGAQLAELNAGLASVLNVRDEGVLVVDVMPGSPAMNAGLEPGDVILRADTIAVVNPVALIRAMRIATDKSVLLELLRRGKAQRVTLRW